MLRIACLSFLSDYLGVAINDQHLALLWNAAELCVSSSVRCGVVFGRHLVPGDTMEGYNAERHGN